MVIYSPTLEMANQRNHLRNGIQRFAILTDVGSKSSHERTANDHLLSPRFLERNVILIGIEKSSVVKMPLTRSQVSILVIDEVGKHLHVIRRQSRNMEHIVRRIITDQSG